MSEDFEYDHTKQWKDTGNACVNWIGTLFNRDLEEFKDKIAGSIETALKYCLFQVERGSETGREHIQIFLQLREKKRFSWLKNFFGSNQDHWEPARSPAKSRNYCKKEETRVAGPFEYGEWAGGEGGKGKNKRDWTEAFEEIDSLSRSEHMRKYPELWSMRGNNLNLLFNNKYSKPDAPLEFTPNAWQSFLKSELDQPADARRVYWVYDSDGNSGKSTFARWIASQRDTYFTSVAAADRNYFAYDGQGLVIYDIPRTIDDPNGDRGAAKFPYQQLEKFKDGNLPAGMFGSAPKHFPCPHVCVFANFEPIVDRLTHDRWFIVDLAGDGWRSGGPILSEPVGDGRNKGKRVYWGLARTDGQLAGGTGLLPYAGRGDSSDAE